MKKTVFIRDDDVYACTKNFISLFDFFKAHKIPVIYAVIPQLAKKKLVSFLNKEKRLNPCLLDIVQHGFSHKNYSNNPANKYEFGPLRTYAQQRRDIIRGYKKMAGLFKDYFTPAFVPPFHGYDNNTLRIINEMGIPLFSSGQRTKLAHKHFFDFPAELSLNDYNKTGAPISIEAKQMIKKILPYLERNNNIGMVFHHAAIKNSALFKEIKLFFLFLKKLREKGELEITLFSRLLAEHSSLTPRFRK